MVFNTLCYLCSCTYSFSSRNNNSIEAKVSALAGHHKGGRQELGKHTRYTITSKGLLICDRVCGNIPLVILFSYRAILVPPCSSTLGTPRGAVRFALSHTVSKLCASLCWHRVHVTRRKQAFLLD